MSQLIRLALLTYRLMVIGHMQYQTYKHIRGGPAQKGLIALEIPQTFQHLSMRDRMLE